MVAIEMANLLPQPLANYPTSFLLPFPRVYHTILYPINKPSLLYFSGYLPGISRYLAGKIFRIYGID